MGADPSRISVYASPYDECTFTQIIPQILPISIAPHKHLTALEAAVSADFVEMISLLLNKYKVAADCFAIRAALRKPEILEYLLTHASQISFAESELFEQPIHRVIGDYNINDTQAVQAIRWDSIFRWKLLLPALFSLLVKFGVNVNVRDLEGRTPLWRAADSGRLEIVKTLCELGGDPSLRVHTT